MKLREFVEKFVSHGDIVYLYDKQKKVSEEDPLASWWHWDLLWKGQDWQITYGPDDEGYFKIHPEMNKCPYKDCEVVSICPAIDGFGGCTDEVGIVIKI